ncbi:hypothetical protein BigBertha_120 [Bacillus phage BigBertha]|uniref:Uncharacterized protein n=1 Tax=Bacillus phage BigBertha TaxID=1406781 RepID=U5PW12_9CAUD|nr:hypothetical protein BigBertha_120 [Bacillus phage BigBertha]AGY46628.1 hypothetical protein BigBertha_120 [Bacillus phage BigBertha]
MKLHCRCFPEDYGHICKNTDGSLYIEVTNDISGDIETASLNIDPQTLYKWLTTEYDIKTLQGEAEEK